MSLLIVIIIIILVLVSVISYFFIFNKSTYNKYSCKNNSCVIDPNGIYNSIEKCQDVCEITPRPTLTNYSCINNNCDYDSNGIYSSLVDCNKNCKNNQPLSGKCIDNTSFQQSAQNNVSKMYNNFYDCLKDNEFKCIRAGEILSLRDYLSIFSFAYFPLNFNIVLSYTTHSINKKDLSNPKKSKPVSTSDPIEVVIYYTGQLYTLIGDLGDAKTGKNEELTTVLTNLLKDLKQSCVDVFKNNTMKDSNGNVIEGAPTWDKYFKYPGPFGRKWGDNINVDWSEIINYKDKNSALYLGSRDFLSNQFWGKTIPKQGSTTSQALSQLVETQVDASIKKYNNLLDLGGDKKEWATDKVLNNSKNIDTYHVFRKAIRSLDRTIEKFPQVVTGFYKNLSTKLVDYVNNNYNSSVSTELTYGDVLCLHTFKCGKDKVVYPIANLIFIGKFKAEFFGLSNDDFNCIRALLLIKLAGLGSSDSSEFSKKYLRNAIPCPSKLNDYPKSPYGWVAPTIDNKGNISGNICELVDFFGDIHDQLVIIQQQIDKKQQINRNLFNYCVKSCQSLQKFMNSINMIQVLNNIKNGLCN